MTEAATRTRRSRPSGQLTGVLLVIVSACSFGSGALLVRGPYAAGMEALAILFWRFLIAAAVSWLFVLALPGGRRSLRSLSPRRMLVLLLLGALYVGNSGTYVAALEVVPITLVTIITYIYPGLVAVLSVRFIRRLSGRRAWLALGISMLGVALALGGVPATDMPPPLGLILAFASPTIYAGWIVLQARLTGDRPARRPDSQGPPGLDVPPGEAETVPSGPDAAPAAALMTSATCLVFAVALLSTGGSVSPSAVPADAWFGLLGFGVIATAVAIQTFYAGVGRIGGARAALVSTVEPVFTITLAALFFGEFLTPLQLAGGLLVIGGVLLAESGDRGVGVPLRPGRSPRRLPLLYSWRGGPSGTTGDPPDATGRKE